MLGIFYTFLDECGIYIWGKQNESSAYSDFSETHTIMATIRH